MCVWTPIHAIVYSSSRALPLASLAFVQAQERAEEASREAKEAVAEQHRLKDKNAALEAQVGAWRGVGVRGAGGGG